MNVRFFDIAMCDYEGPASDAEHLYRAVTGNACDDGLYFEYAADADAAELFDAVDSALLRGYGRTHRACTEIYDETARVAVKRP